MAWIETLHWKVGPHQKKATVGNLLADDGAYSFEHKDPTVLSRMITEKNNLLENCMNNNRLVINPDKTHMMVMGNKNVEPLRQQIIMMAGNFIIHPTKTERSSPSVSRVEPALDRWQDIPCQAADWQN